MFGFSFSLEGDAAPPAGFSSHSFANMEAAALVGRFAVPPSEKRKAAIDQLTSTLKQMGIWSRLDCLWVIAAHDEQAAQCNWKGSGNSLTLGGNPLFVVDKGYFTDGLDDYLHCNYAPSSDGVAYTLNNAMFGCWTRFAGSQANGSANMGTISAGACRLNPRGPSGTVAANVNASANTTTSTAVVPTGYGLTCADRISATQVKLMRNGVRLHLASAASTSVPASSMGIGRSNNLFAQNQYAAAFIGGSLSDAEHLALYDALAAYMDAVEMGDPVITTMFPTTATRALTGGLILPDGASGSMAGMGWTCTGLARLPDGSYLVSNDGRSVIGSANRPSIVHISTDGTTILHEWTGVALGLPAVSMQGVAWEDVGAGGIRGQLWLVMKTVGTATVYSLPIFDDWSAGTLTMLPTAHADANGIAVDTRRDQILLCINAASASLQWFDKADLAKPLRTYALNYGVDNDHLVYDAATDSVYVTSGANGQNGRVSRIAMDGAGYGGPVVVEETVLTGADAIEGLAFAGSMMVIANDAYFHGGNPALNRLLFYAAS